MGRNNPSSKCGQNSQVNGQGGKNKWKNLHSIAKKEFAEFKRENKITGGGWPPKSPSIASKEIIEVLEDMHNRSKPNKPLQLHSMQIL